MRVNLHGIDCGGISGSGLVSDGCELVGLGINGVRGLLAGDSGLLEDSDLLLGDGSRLLAHHYDMGAVLGLDDHGLVHGSSDNALESGNHVGLGHPADVSEFAVSGGILVDREFGDKAGEVGTLAHHCDEAVCSLSCIRSLKEDVLHIGRVGDGLGVHHAYCIEGFAIGDDRRDGALAFEHEVIDILVDAVEFACFVPVVGELAVGVLQKEGLHVVGICELVVSLCELVIGCGDILC